MKKLFSVLLAVAMLTSNGVANITSAEEADSVIYVSAELGNDANSGTVDAPLKTIDRARLMARELPGKVTVEIMEGEYRLSSEITFTAEDSDVTYKAYSTDKPVIKGSVEIPASAAAKVSDETALAKMTENAKKDAYVINLADYGITKEMIVDASLTNSQYAHGDRLEFNTFYVNGESFTVAQWPNNNDYAVHNGEYDDTSIIYAEDYCDKWAGETGWWVGLWIPYDYSFFRYGGVSIDAENNVLDYIDTASIGFDKQYYSKRWKAYNLISEMDVPGEYYIDRENLKLYFYPTSAIMGSKFEFENGVKEFFNIQNAENITFDGLTFTQTAGSGINAKDVKNIDIRNCTFKDIGYVALTYGASKVADTGNKYTDEDGKTAQFWQFQKKHGSYDCDIENNTFMNIGSYALSISGAGDIDTLTPSNNYIRNNIFYNVSSKSALYGMNISGCGNVIEHNNISRSMMGAIYLNGNNHTVQYNEIYNCMTDSADGGAIYQGRADVFRGSKVQYNYIHDMTLDDSKTYEKLNPWQIGIYWDDGQTGMRATHNIFANIRTAFNSNHAGDYVHSFNTTVNCEKAWSLIDYPHGEVDVRTHAANGFTLAQLQELIVNKELYYDEYDNLQDIAENGKNPRKLNVLEGNLRVNSGVSEEPYNKANATFTNNKDAGTYEEKVDLTEIFVDPENQDYRVKSDSEFANIGVLNESFNIDLIGIQNDFELNEETATFENLYPANNANIGYQTEYNFNWSKALGANKYKLTVASDKDFDNVVFEKETMQNAAVVTGLSDETVYYWKVEAENTSRELANTWESEVTAFGVNVSMFEDSELPQMNANIIFDPDELNDLTHGNGHGDMSWVAGDYFRWTEKAIGVSKNYAAGPTSMTYALGDITANFVANKNYVMSVRLKNSAPEVRNPITFNMSLNYIKIPAVSFAVDSSEYKTYKAEFTPTDDATMVNLGIDATIDRTAYTEFGSIDMDLSNGGSLYIAEEQAYDIGFSGRNVLNSSSPAVIDADIINQIGNKGNLLQSEFEFAVLNQDRTDYADGFTLTQNSSDSSIVTISVDDSVEAGRYILFAKGGDFKKGFEIEVVDNFKDKTVEKNENMITDPDNINKLVHSNGMSDRDFVTGQYFRWIEKANPASTSHVAGLTSMSVGQDDLTEGFVANENYVISVRLKNPTPEIRTPMTFNMGTYPVKTPYASFSVDSTEYKTYTENFKAIADSTSIQLGVDATIDRTAYTEFGAIDMDITNGGSLYVAKEQAYEIALSGDEVIVAENPSEISAEIKNQVGNKYTKSQDIKFIVTDIARETVINGFEVEGNKITADSSVPSGEYALVAMAEGIVESYEFRVINGFEDSAEYEFNDNIISDPDSINNFEHNNGTKVTSSFASGDYYAWTEQAVAKESYWGVGSTCLQLSDKYSDLTESFVKGKNYVISVRLKNANPDAGDTVEFAYGLSYLKEGTIAVTSTEYQTYTSAFTASLDSAVLALGFDTKVDRSAYTELASVAMDISNGGSLYVAEEAAAEIKITADNKTLTPLDSINATAEVLNQIGEKGNLNQDVEWYVVTKDRSRVAEGFKIEKTETGVEVSVDGAESGEYALVAVSDTRIKGVDIKVVANYNDTETPEMNQNLLKDGACSGSGWGNNAAWGYTAYADGRNGGAVKVHSTKDIAVADYNPYWYAYGVMPSKFISDDKTAVFEADKNYVLSVWAKDIKESEEIPYSKITMAFMSNKGKSYLDTYPQATCMTLTDNWQEFKGTFTVPTGYTSYSGLTIGYPTTVETKAGMAMAIDDAYLAEEQAYSIEIEGGSEIAVGENATYSAKLLNQIGTCGKLSQGFDWMVLNADRTAMADGITVTENQDGTVTVTGVTEGTYTLLAMSETENFIKGYQITVSAQVETPVEKIASAVFTANGNNVNFKATVENTDAEDILFVIGEFNGKTLVQSVKSDIKSANDANCDLTLENVTVGNTIRAFIWDNGTLLPIDNVDNLALSYTVTQ